MISGDIKKALLFLALIISVVLVIDRSLGALLSYLHRNSLVGETGGKINAYKQLPERPTLTIMGNSRTVFTIIPDSLPFSTYNLSQPGMDLSYQAGLMHMLSQEQKLGKTVLLLVDPQDFIYYETDPHTPLDAQHLKHYYGTDTLITKYVKNISRFEQFKCLFTLYRYNGAFLNLAGFFVKTRLGRTDGSGYRELPPTPRDSANTLKHTRQVQSEPVATHLSPVTIGFLQDIVSICQRTNTRLICITPPFFYDTSIKYASAYRYLDSFLAKNKIQHIDYSRTTLPGLENPAFWKDAVHPNVYGAQIMSHDLAKQLRQLSIIP
jgi:hypothetical protein